MTYDFLTRLDNLGTRKKQLTSTIVNYQDGIILIPNLIANYGETEIDDSDSGGNLITIKSRDYLFTFADWLYNGVLILPREGALIVDGMHTCKIASLPGKPHYQFTTASEKRIRVHTKVIQ